MCCPYIILYLNVLSFFCESSIDADVIPQTQILNLVAEVMKNEKIKPNDNKAVFIEQVPTSEPDKIVLKAIVFDISEQKGLEDDEITKPELKKHQKVYTETFSIAEELGEQVVPVDEMPEYLSIMSGPKPKEVKVVLDVRDRP